MFTFGGRSSSVARSLNLSFAVENSLVSQLVGKLKDVLLTQGATLILAVFHCIHTLHIYSFPPHIFGQSCSINFGVHVDIWYIELE